MPITRRLFLGAAFGCFALPHAAARQETRPTEAVNFTRSEIEQLRQELLNLANIERAIAGVAPLEMNELAAGVAQEHALDMATGGFLSHWGSDGRKPYHRYSLAGGTDALAENVAAYDNILTVRAVDIAKDLTAMHMRMHSEVAPYDAHRRTILEPHFTHVGFGIALAKGRLRLAEEYVGRHVELDPLQRRRRPKAKLNLTGRLLRASDSLRLVEVFYEPLPAPPPGDWLRTLRPYGLPDTFVSLHPRLPKEMIYADGSRGSIEFDRSGRFNVPVSLFKPTEGIYTVVFWLNDKRSEKPFQATAVCIECRD